MEPFLVGKGYLTELWITQEAIQKIKNDCDDAAACVKKLTGYCQAGLWNLEGEENAHVRHEVGHTYRIRYKGSTLYRIVGFYETPQKKAFMVLDAFFKASGRDYSNAQWTRMQEISQIKERGKWTKKQPPKP